MEATREIETLVDFGGRGAGSDAERRAADHLVKRLEELGRDAETESINVYPNWAASLAIHAVLAVIASVASVLIPLIGAALAVLVAVSAFAEVSGTFYLVRRLTGRRASQNVISREKADKPGTLVLVAHYDTGKPGSIFSRRAQERRAALSQRLKTPIGLFQVFFFSILAVAAFALLRVLGLNQLLFSVLQFIPTVILIVSVPLLIDVALGKPGPGASDNASGVATVLRLAERFGGGLEHFNLWVLFTGAGEGLAAGMRAFLDRHDDDLTNETTIFLNIDTVGQGTVRYATREGLAFPNDYHPSLVEVCQEIAEEDAGEEGEGENRFAARGVVSRSTSDAFPARTKGYPAITISCLNALDYAPNRYSPDDTPDRIDGEALERAYGFCEAVIARIDDKIGTDVAEAGEESVLAEEQE